MSKCDKPCASCPWLAVNQTKEAVKNSPMPPHLPFTPKKDQPLRWFDPRNLKKHWSAVAANGSMMPCHATDPNAHRYGGKKVKADSQSRVCIGLTILAKREVTEFLKQGGEYRRYRAQPGRRMSLLGLATWGARLTHPGATFHAGEAALILPTVDDDDRVTVPWPDTVHQR
jgi:hypothetical protein